MEQLYAPPFGQLDDLRSLVRGMLGFVVLAFGGMSLLVFGHCLRIIDRYVITS